MAIEGKKFSEFPDALQGEVVVVGLQNGQNVKVVLNTQAVTTTPEVIYRDAKGRFKSKVNLPHLANSLDNFRFIADVLDDHEARIEDQNGTIGRLEDLILEYYKQVSNELPTMDGGVIEYDDTELRKLIEDEEIYRKQGDRELHDRIDRLVLQGPDTIYDDTEVRQLITDEEGSRVAADLAINHLIACEAEAREDADKAIIDMIEGYNPDVSDFNQKLDKEIKDRIAGDDALGELISNNAKEIESIDDRVTDLENQAPVEGGPGYDDSELQAALAQEVEDRIEGDEINAKALAQEVEDRGEGDKTLQEQIDEIRVELDGVETIVEGHVFRVVEHQGLLKGEARFGNPGGTYFAQGTLWFGETDVLGEPTDLPYKKDDLIRINESDSNDYCIGKVISVNNFAPRRIDFTVIEAQGSPSKGDLISLSWEDHVKEDITQELDQRYAMIDHDHDGYADEDHNHDQQYAHIQHAHDVRYAMIDHTHPEFENLGGGEVGEHDHDGVYAFKQHSHPAYAAESHTHSDYAHKDHGHDEYQPKGSYAASNHTHSGYASSSHTHSNYASSSHTHSGYASSTHSHDTSYVKLSGDQNSITGTKTVTGTFNFRGGYAQVVKSSSTTKSGCFYKSGSALYWVP